MGTPRIWNHLIHRLWVLNSLHDWSREELFVLVMVSGTGLLAFDSWVTDKRTRHSKQQPDFHGEQDTLRMIVDVKRHWKVCCLCCPSPTVERVKKASHQISNDRHAKISQQATLKALLPPRTLQL